LWIEFGFDENFETCCRQFECLMSICCQLKFDDRQMTSEKIGHEFEQVLMEQRSLSRVLEGLEISKYI
jgi:hypothetical protein